MKAAGCPLPTAIETAGGGGIVGWQCICGALAGTIDAIGAFHGRTIRGGSETTRELAHQMMDWFTKTAGAPCCHVSATTRSKNEGWFGKNWGCPEHLYSCSLWTGRVVEHAVELLNMKADGTIVSYTPPEYTKGCQACHNPMTGVSDCFACHDQKSYTERPHTHAPVGESLRTPKQPNYLEREKGYLSSKT